MPQTSTAQWASFQACAGCGVGFLTGDDVMEFLFNGMGDKLTAN